MSVVPQPVVKQKNWFVRHKIISGILGFFVFVTIIGLFSGDKSSTPSSSSTSNNATVQSSPKETAAPVAEKSYQQVFTFKGNGAKKSEPFTITGDRFKIAYDCKGDLCQSFLYKAGSNIPSSIIMNATGAQKDETIIYGKGDYYIDANTIGSYTMTVYDYK